MSKPVIILEDLNFDWQPEDIQKAIHMWQSGYGVTAISQHLRSPATSGKTGADAEYETALLIMHLSRENLISLDRNNNPQGAAEGSSTC
ncbi:hypothetical protein [Anoxynatronum buryatiense]|uniref:Uncharacterized protein n=1 Tax=Anoxynatronum buryatiense TaxID=489973 RepID=A0AA45WSM4_9CLOT|nr:hypothetical protein [Anoxynatronum buryatiense]SMP38321.1 hypothetical protein SAMN06296020_10183 [Anoxynatronum buryatiense]